MLPIVTSAGSTAVESSGATVFIEVDYVFNGLVYTQSGSGTLLKDGWVLTAAHVVGASEFPLDNGSKVTRYPRAVRTFHGSPKRAGGDKLPITSGGLFVHPYYEGAGGPSRFDLALYRVAAPKTATTADIAPSIPQVGTVVHALGWGGTGLKDGASTGLSEVLRRAEFRLVKSHPAIMIGQPLGNGNDPTLVIEGDSGGGVYDARDALCAVICHRFLNMAPTALDEIGDDAQSGFIPLHPLTTSWINSVIGGQA